MCSCPKLKPHLNRTATLLLEWGWCLRDKAGCEIIIIIIAIYLIELPLRVVVALNLPDGVDLLANTTKEFANQIDHFATGHSDHQQHSDLSNKSMSKSTISGFPHQPPPPPPPPSEA